MSADQEVKRWVKVNRPAAGRMVVTVTLMSGHVTAKQAVRTDQSTLRRDTTACYRRTLASLNELVEIDALFDIKEDA